MFDSEFSENYQQSDDDRFVDLTLRYLDDLVTSEELAGLNKMLADDNNRRALFVQICRLQGLLAESLVPRRVILAAEKVLATPYRLLEPDSPATLQTRPGSSRTGAQQAAAEQEQLLSVLLGDGDGERVDVPVPGLHPGEDTVADRLVPDDTIATDGTKPPAVNDDEKGNVGS
jgi:hypothetical protein